ncbi:MAG TPA: hypothetical protein VF494_00245 [Candidatus Limnocylindrales bacterium]
MAASSVLVSVVLSFVMGGLVSAAPGGVTDPAGLTDLAAVRQATARYHDVDRALADGYVPFSPCVAEPGLGTMGIHFVNFGLAFDLTVSATSPEILLYVPSEDGYRLVGVEYVVFYVGQPAPQVFGRPLNGPMVHPGEESFLHYDLHAWVWQGNPAGIFADFNPALTC